MPQSIPTPQEAVDCVRRMLAAQSINHMIPLAVLAHDYLHMVNPEDAYPTNHHVDMLNSCVSAIRFGLETPCKSRHAAAAAQHVWSQLYGVKRFDSATPAWEKDWARSIMQDAVLGLAIDQLEAAQSQAKEHAVLMREAADALESACHVPAKTGMYATWLCRWCDELHGHTPDCIVTKLRDAADRAEGK